MAEQTSILSSDTLTHLRYLEAESIHIMREVASEFKNPVMLYSIGKDSTVMAHLALKAFAPGRIPFPFQHIDTTFKFKEMYEYEMNLMISQDKHEYKDNKYEIAAEEFGRKNWKKWYNKFKKDKLF